jgi:hypothetical protein
MWCVRTSVFGAETAFAETARFIKVSALIR